MKRLHIHDEAFVQEMKKHNISCIANAATKDEYAFLKEMQQIYEGIHISFGIHPWNAEKQTFEEELASLEETSFIGEIGMDNVWCDCSIAKQKKILQEQLAYASKHHKPVILHTKGMEEEIATCIKEYPNHYLVHWYSCMDHLQTYIDLGCYFTIGVSFMQDEAVKQVALKAPSNRILLESDGLGAVEWAMNRKIDVKDYYHILETSLENLAKLRNVGIDDLYTQMNQNYEEFIKLGENR